MEINFLINFSEQASKFLENLQKFSWEDKFWLPLLSTAIGAGIAFFFTWNYERKKEKQLNIEVINHALSRLLFQLSRVYQYYKNDIEPNLNNEEIIFLKNINSFVLNERLILRSLNIPASIHIELDKLNLDVKSLAYLFNNNNKELELNLMNQEIIYQDCIKWINLRSEYLFAIREKYNLAEKDWYKIDLVNDIMNIHMDLHKILQLIPDLYIREYIIYTHKMINEVKNCIEKSQNNIAQLINAFYKEMPKETDNIIDINKFENPEWIPIKELKQKIKEFKN